MSNTSVSVIGGVCVLAILGWLFSMMHEDNVGQARAQKVCSDYADGLKGEYGAYGTASYIGDGKAKCYFKQEDETGKREVNIQVFDIPGWGK